jgi:hypothetical protein
MAAKQQDGNGSNGSIGRVIGIIRVVSKKNYEEKNIFELLSIVIKGSEGS